MAKRHLPTSHRAVLFLLTALLICFAPLGAPNISWAAGEWVLVESNESSRVSCIAFDPQQPNIIYLGDSCHGLSKTSDDGNNWTGINNGISFTPSGSCSPICSLVVNPQNTNTLFAGWNDPSNPNAPMVGLWKTTDGGQNWVRLESGLSCRQILSLAIDPQNPTIIYAGTSCGVFKTTNGGGSWAAANQGIPVTEIGALAVDPQNAQAVYAATSQAIYKSINGGSTWSIENNAVNFSQVRGLVVDPQNSAVLYVGFSQGVWKSTDSGKTWMEMNGGLADRGIRTLAIDPQDPAYLYAWTNTGVYKVQLIGASATSVQASISASSSPTQPIIAINCGGPQVTAKSGMVYQVDNGSTGGQNYSTTAAISGTDDPKLYQTERFGNFSYKFKVVNGNYTLVLKFAEIYENAANRRKFSVKIEGREVISSLDLYAQVGKNRPYDVTIPVTVSDGELNIDFITVQGNAKVNALAVYPGTVAPQTASTTQTTQTPTSPTTQTIIPSTTSGAQTGSLTTTATQPLAAQAQASTQNQTVTVPTEFLRCGFDNTLNCGSLTPNAGSYNAQYKTGRKVWYEADRGLLTTNHSTSNKLSYPTTSSVFQTFKDNGSVSLWVKPLFDPAPNGPAHVIFQMAVVNAGNVDPNNRLALFIAGNQLKFLGRCAGNPCQDQMIMLDQLDQAIPMGGNGEINHFRWRSGKWHHVVIAWKNQESQTGMSLYVDGGLVARNSSYSHKFAILPNEFYVGSRFAGDSPFNGVIDDIRFFDNSLTDWQVQQLFKDDYYSVRAAANVDDYLLPPINLTTTGFGNKGLGKIEARSLGTITLTYTVPPGITIQKDGGVRVFRKHGTGNPEMEDFRTQPSNTANARALLLNSTGNSGAMNVTNPAGVLTCLSGDSDPNKRLSSVVDCYFILTQGELRQGEKIRFEFGTIGRNILAGPSAAEVPNIKFSVAVDKGEEAGGMFYEIPDALQPTLQTVHSNFSRLVAIAPSSAPLSGPLSFVVVAEDAYRNPVGSYRGRIRVYLDSSNTPLILDQSGNTAYSFTEADKGYHRFTLPALNFIGDGGHVLRIVEEDSGGNGISTGYSNVVLASNNQGGYKLYWGDLHAHSKISDGSIEHDKTYDFMRNVANLDFAAIADHVADPGDTYNSMDFGNFPNLNDWKEMIRIANAKNQENTFVTLPGYEYSQGSIHKLLRCLNDSTNYPNAKDTFCPGVDGDWNVHFNFPANLGEEALNSAAAATLWGTNSFTELLNGARGWESANPGKVFIIPHHGGRHADIRHIASATNNLVPAIEITSKHVNAPVNFEAWAQNALRAGNKIGFMASSDNHSGTAGKVPGGFIGVWATDLTREAIFNAIKARRVIGASRQDRPYIKTTIVMNGKEHFMGEEVTIPQNASPNLVIEVGSYKGAQKVEIFQDEQVAATFGSFEDHFKRITYPCDFSVDQRGIDFNRNSRIYVKVTQKTEEAPYSAEGIAWSSPMFIAVSGNANPPTNSLAAGNVRYVDYKGQWKPAVELTFNASPTPQNTVGGQGSGTVIKIIISDNPNVPENILYDTLARARCEDEGSPISSKAFCLSAFPAGGKKDFIFDQAFTGDRYLYATFYNDEQHTARNYWAPYACNCAFSRPVVSGRINMSGIQPPTTNLTITGTAGANGSISPSGTFTVNQGESRTFTITPASGYRVEDVKDNGVSKGSITSYPLTNITANHTITASFVQQTTPSSTQVVFAVNCGSPTPYTDSTGITYEKDNSSYYSGGGTYSTTAPIGGTNDNPLYQTERWGGFSYTFPVAIGSYNVTLKFAELYETAAGRRIFSAKINGQEVITNLDLFAVTGGQYKAYVRTFPVNVTTGKIIIEFYFAKGNAKVNAILITKGQTPQPATQYTITATAGAGGSINPSGPVVVNAGASQTFTITPQTSYQVADVKINGVSQGAKTSYTFTNVTANQSIAATFAATGGGGGAGDVVFALNCGSNQAYTGGGVTYQADTNTSIVTGGQSYSVTASIAGTTEGSLYQTERYGMTAYRIPIANGTYDVTLKFAELYCSAANCRVFSATIEGIAAVTNLDLFAQAGKYKAYDVTKTVTVADGYLDIRFSAAKSTAKINGILVKKR